MVLAVPNVIDVPAKMTKFFEVPRDTFGCPYIAAGSTEEPPWKVMAAWASALPFKRAN
jgi:hypothetical protein